MKYIKNGSLVGSPRLFFILFFTSLAVLFLDVICNVFKDYYLIYKHVDKMRIPVPLINMKYFVKANMKLL